MAREAAARVPDAELLRQIHVSVAVGAMTAEAGATLIGMIVAIDKLTFKMGHLRRGSGGCRW